MTLYTRHWQYDSAIEATLDPEKAAEWKRDTQKMSLTSVRTWKEREEGRHMTDKHAPMKPFYVAVDVKTGEAIDDIYRARNKVERAYQGGIAAGTHRIARCVEEGVQGERATEMQAVSVCGVLHIIGLVDGKPHLWNGKAWIEMPSIPQSEPAPAPPDFVGELHNLLAEIDQQSALPQIRGDDFADGCNKASAFIAKRLAALIQKHAAAKPEPTPACVAPFKVGDTVRAKHNVQGESHGSVEKGTVGKVWSRSSRGMIQLTNGSFWVKEDAFELAEPAQASGDLERELRALSSEWADEVVRLKRGLLNGLAGEVEKCKARLDAILAKGGK